MLDLKKEDCIMMESGMDVDRRYTLIRKMNVLQGEYYFIQYYSVLYSPVKQKATWWP